ncbi:hypothetical protein J3459_013613 [Metarhizium acridum]|uniref:uncharacterized protein n=1 Tax=Metarhizium acridum TaxID=92637 RepID=UPI001C6BB43E|nr:hypothetical protein J3459_013613 [Metarhizium acridum]KAG8421732.1 hypothetical protein J3458_003581 [Metarhizium acridum]
MYTDRYPGASYDRRLECLKVVMQQKVWWQSLETTAWVRIFSSSFRSTVDIRQSTEFLTSGRSIAMAVWGRQRKVLGPAAAHVSILPLLRAPGATTSTHVFAQVCFKSSATASDDQSPSRLMGYPRPKSVSTLASFFMGIHKPDTHAAPPVAQPAGARPRPQFSPQVVAALGQATAGVPALPVSGRLAAECAPGQTSFS